MRPMKFICVLIIMAVLSFQYACRDDDNGKDNASGEGHESSASGDSAGRGSFGPMDKYEPGITLTVAGTVKEAESDFPAGMDHENNPWKEAYKNELGISFENKWEVHGGKYLEKLTTQISAGDIPDILHSVGRSHFDQLMRLGLAAPMDQYLEKYGTELAKKVLTSDGGYSLLYSTGDDGKLYALPHTYGYIDNVCVMWIRTDWLKKVNLKAPETMDELYLLAKAFVEQDPDGNGKNDTLGLISSNSIWELGSIFNGFGSQPFWSWYLDAAGRLKYSTCYAPENTKRALEYLAKLYSEGYMYQEFGAASAEKYLELLDSGKAGIAFLPNWFPSRYGIGSILEDPDADWEGYAIPSGLEGNKPARPFAYYGPAAYNVVSSKCKYPEAAVQLLNLYCEKVFGQSVETNFEKYIMSTGGDNNKYNMKSFAIIGTEWANRLDLYENVARAVEIKNPTGLTPEEKHYYEKCRAYENGDRKQWAEYKTYGPGNETMSVVSHYIDNATPLFNNFYNFGIQSVKQYQGDLDAKWVTACIEIIMGKKPVSAYDTFVKEWYSLGGDIMEKDVNEFAKAHPESVR